MVAWSVFSSWKRNGISEFLNLPPNLFKSTSWYFRSGGPLRGTHSTPTWRLYKGDQFGHISFVSYLSNPMKLQEGRNFRNLNFDMPLDHDLGYWFGYYPIMVIFVVLMNLEPLSLSHTHKESIFGHSPCGFCPGLRPKFCVSSHCFMVTLLLFHVY